MKRIRCYSPICTLADKPSHTANGRQPFDRRQERSTWQADKDTLTSALRHPRIRHSAYLTQTHKLDAGSLPGVLQEAITSPASVLCITIDGALC